MAMQLNSHGGAAVEVSEVTFGREYNVALVHQVVTAYLAAGRSGTKAQRNRSAARGSQRAGTLSSWSFDLSALGLAMRTS